MDFYICDQSCAIHFSCAKERKETKNRIEWGAQLVVREIRPKAKEAAIFAEGHLKKEIEGVYRSAKDHDFILVSF